MNQEELAAVRPRLEEFAAEVFAPLARADQRDKGATYVRGLLLDGRRKSMQPMAERLGVDHQGLQQLLSSSTWAVEEETNCCNPWWSTPSRSAIGCIDLRRPSSSNPRRYVAPLSR